MPLRALIYGPLLLLAAAPAKPELAPVMIEGVPHVRQRPDFCGEACAEMWLGHLGSPLTQDDVFAAAGLDPALGRGLYAPELARALTALGFAVGEVWYRLPPGDAEATAIDAQFRALHTDLVAGIPSIVCMHYDDQPATTEHFRLVLGYLPKTDEVVFHEPALAAAGYRSLPRREFEELWPLRLGAGGRTVIRLRLEATRLVEPTPTASPTPADLAQHVLALKQRLPAGFTIAVEPPFVVIGDEAPAKVRARARDNVRWTATRLTRDFFAQNPAEILDVWLFQDRASYERHTWELFHVKPDTPYGYYSPAERALVMNIGPGWGTLSHELVHPYVHTNFPSCPPWLNEGLASLFEQPRDRDGHLIGGLNWRLPGLQAALRAGEVPPLAELLAMNEATFYGDRSDVHYAAARYLLYDLQERGLLVDFVRRAQANAAADPSGRATLLAVLEHTDLDAFDRDWREAVLALRREGRLGRK